MYRTSGYGFPLAKFGYAEHGMVLLLLRVVVVFFFFFLAEVVEDVGRLEVQGVYSFALRI